MEVVIIGGLLILSTTVLYIKRSAENRQYRFGLTQAEFLNFSN